MLFWALPAFLAAFPEVLGAMVNGDYDQPVEVELFKSNFGVRLGGLVGRGWLERVANGRREPEPGCTGEGLV